MDWTPENPDLAGGASAAAADLLSSGPGRRPPARRISHRKNPSDTFAFAAGQLFHSTPEDFYNLLETRGEFKSDAYAAAARQGAALQQAAQDSFDQQQQLLGHKSASTQNLQGVSAAVHQSTVDAAIPTPSSAAAAAAAQQDPHAGAIPADSTAQQQEAAALATEAAAAAAAEPYEYMQEEHDHDQDYEQELAEQQQQRRRGHHRSGSGGSSGGGGQTRTNALDTTQLDPRRAKRILANRQSAQRSRMKRLQYIHELENKSATAVASVKELQREVDKMEQKQKELNETVESSRAQVDSLAQQLFLEQQMQAALMRAISDLRSHASYIQQQQQQQWLHQHQHMPNGSSMYATHQPLQQQQHQQQHQPIAEVKQEPLSQPAAAAGPVLYGHPQYHAQQQQPQEAYQQQDAYHHNQHHHQQQQGYRGLHGPGRPGVYEQQQQYVPHLPPHACPQRADAGRPRTTTPPAAAPGVDVAASSQHFGGAGAKHAGASGHLLYNQQQQQQSQIQQLAMQQLQQRAGRTSPHARFAQQQQQQQAQLPPQHPAVPTDSTAAHWGQYGQGSTASTVVLPGVVVGSTAAAPLGFQVSGPVPEIEPADTVRSNSGGGGGSSGMYTLPSQQQLNGHGSNGPVLRQSPSPSQALGIDFDRSLSMGLGSSMSTPMPGLEGGLDIGMLADGAYMDAGLDLAPSGPLQMGRMDSFTLKQDDILGVQAAAGLDVDLRKTSSM